MFKSGLNMGNGLTYKLDERINENGHFLDTPGLADEKLRKAAGGAISEGLRMGGQFKVLFFVTEQRGRVVQQDATTMQLVHEAAPEIKSHYGVIVNMVSKGVLKRLNQTEMSFFEFLNTLFAGMADENRCIYSNIFVSYFYFITFYFFYLLSRRSAAMIHTLCFVCLFVHDSKSVYACMSVGWH